MLRERPVTFLAFSLRSPQAYSSGACFEGDSLQIQPLTLTMQSRKGPFYDSTLWLLDPLLTVALLVRHVLNVPYALKVQKV